ncbi:1906_t:CDS:2 [Funneliformis mosseae]|uniref:1906_t:CDS:1 n=1 Tax=Funneliformis mosseae TaxID=27381 RepID=A0A9N8V2J0_FUNMO|nr:1906_t:CDS:2 [Funneliformis mosseae]
MLSLVKDEKGTKDERRGNKIKIFKLAAKADKFGKDKFNRYFCFGFGLHLPSIRERSRHIYQIQGPEGVIMLIPFLYHKPPKSPNFLFAISTTMFPFNISVVELSVSSIFDESSFQNLPIPT